MHCTYIALHYCKIVPATRMQETEFIEQNKDKWSEFEQVLLNRNKDPERVTELFIETTDDLSYSRTYYRNRSVRVYLNGIAQQVYQVVYKNKKREKNAFVNFWRQELPTALYYQRKAIYFSFILFVAGVSIGLFSSMYYPEFARIILGDTYIEMTKANIASGDPMAVYGTSDELPMFFRIALNNIIVSFICFVAGLLFGVGTVYYILYNAIMVGAFVYFFIERGLFQQCFMAVMLHGTLELSMIMIAGGAGFALARGLMFPGTYSRGQALIKASRSGVRIMIGVSVLLIYAAFIESFLTRHTDIGDSIRLFIILFSAFVVVGYFIIFPIYKKRKGQIAPLPMDEIPKRNETVYALDVIKGAGRIFTETWDLFAAHARVQVIAALCTGIGFTALYLFITHGKLELLQGEWYEYYPTFFDLIYPWDTWDRYFNFEKFPLVYGVHAVAFSAYSILFFYLANRKMKLNNAVSMVDVINSILLSAILLSPLLLDQVFTFFIMPFFTPIILLWMYISFTEKKVFVQTTGRLFALMKGNFWSMVGTFLSMLIMQWLIYFILCADVLNLVIEMVTMNIPRNAPYAEYAFITIYTFIIFFVPACVISLCLYSTALFYHSAREINEANSLFAAISKVGFKNRAYGLEKEI
ncbi:MAG: stage II sporulation protein M [Flavobacteriales bacterium]